MSAAGSELGAVVLCGGSSRRMGRSKAWLPFGDETLLERVVGRVRRAAQPVVVVGSPDQQLPPLPAEVTVLHDPVFGLGPLQGIAVGLQHLEQRGVGYAFVSSTDVPFLEPAFVRYLYRRCLDPPPAAQIAAVELDGHLQPTAAVYDTQLHRLARRLLAQNRPAYAIFEHAPTRLISAPALYEDEELRRADPRLRSLQNLNTPEQYDAALAAEAGADAASRRRME